MSRKIENVAEFCKLYRIRIPFEREFDYYISTLAQSPEYDWLERKVREFSRFEQQLRGKALGSEKMGQVGHLRRSIEATQTYKAFNEAELEAPGERKSNLHRHRGRYLLTLDIHQAYYSVLRCYDTEEELPKTWEKFCKEQDISPLFSSSRNWRQLVFGGLNPKQNQRFQHIFLQSFLNLLRPLGLKETSVLAISGDEAVVVLGESPEEAAQTMQAVDLMAKMVAGRDCSDTIPEPFRGRLKLSSRAFRFLPLEGGSYIREHFALEDEKLKTTHKSLFGVPGNQYYMQFKKYILEGEFDDRDLIFLNDKKLAKWVV